MSYQAVQKFGIDSSANIRRSGGITWLEKDRKSTGSTISLSKGATCGIAFSDKAIKFRLQGKGWSFLIDLVEP